MKHLNLRRAAPAVALITAVCLFGHSVLDHLLTTTETSEIIAPLSDGQYTTVAITTQTKGLFISGGHGWSLGSQKRSYELTFNDGGKTVRWQGAGVPITLQSQGSTYYLATFDRETDFHHVDFKCYVWNGAWKELPTRLFPRKLAVNNLTRFGSDSSTSYDSSEFRWSLLAHFWFCIDSGRPDWEISDSMVDAGFVAKFRESLKN